ncbi:myc induced nuclear antigen [Alloactinosynnema sp. L-07]|uniref:JmjC domain-containing protein n=1 Tax=Alloactinosynnema sp. L-07 TaxID=1653480 RepID=UPI00065F048A|nr:cupin domain-containing protein [Alloactinosynnema sp. L-07]CRK55467.1 myc induced nuclear antigen [Alloactinosynnema sp. L-07]
MDHYLIEAVEKALGWNGSQMLGQRFAKGTMEDAALCTRLLTPTRLLDAIMRRSLTSPQLRCFQGGAELHPDAYLANAVTRRGQTTPMARMDKLGDLIRSGCTVVLDSFDTFDPTMEVACRALQWWSRELVQVNTYLTTNEASGFDLHWDDHDVLIVQLGGEKTWEVRGASRAAPMYRDAEPNRVSSDEVVWAGTMRAGDVMHIPRGYWHQATRTDCGDGYSLHVTFGFVKRTGVDWLAWIADRSREEEVFRTDLKRWALPAEQRAQDLTLSALVPGLLAKYPPLEYLTTRELERPAHRAVRTHGTFGPPMDIVCVTEFPPHIKSNDDTIDVLAAGKAIRFAAAAEPAVRLLLSGNPANVAAVATATSIDARVIAEALTNEGLCVELTDELATGYVGVVGQRASN